MALQEMTENVEIVQTLSDYPNQEEGLSAEELKAKFDQGPKALKEYINDQLVPAVRELERVVDPGMTYNGYNQVISELGFSYGKGNFVGLKGYYYSNIDFTTNEITLSKKLLAADGDGIQLTWEVGDKVSIVSDSKYDLCSTITAINGNVITVDSLPFTELGEDQPDWDDYCIFVPDKPEAGVVDLGRYATAIGEGNRAAARAATAIGRDNIVQSMYGVGIGRSNTIKAYAGVATGAYNTLEAEALYGSTDGLENTVTAPLAHAGGGGSTATKDGADADGYQCEADGEWALARNYKTKATAPYAVALNEETEAGGKGSLTGGKGTKTLFPYQTAFGIYNHVTDNYLFMVGNGQSDTKRDNAFVVRRDGDTDVRFHRIRNLANAVNDGDAVNLSQLNAGLAKKAPAGYGLGETYSTLIDSADNIVANGWYGTNSGTPDANWWLVFACVNNEHYQFQDAYRLYDGAKRRRAKINNVWGEWEDVSSSAFAPAGYGFGEPAEIAEVGSEEELFTFLEQMFQKCQEAVAKKVYIYFTTHVGSIPATSCFMGNVYKFGTMVGGFTGYSYINGFAEISIQRYDTWQAIEWSNPPMFPGVEYRTTERHNGKPVYAKLVDVGKLPDNDITGIEFERSELVDGVVNGVDHVLELKTFIKTKEGYSRLTNSNLTVWSENDDWQDPNDPSHYWSENFIYCETNANLSTLSCLVLIKWCNRII